MTYDEIIEQLEVTKSKIKEIARNEYGGEYGTTTWMR